MAHSIDRKTVATLLNGETYVIPSYQRGYRWTVEQVDELLNDLLVYAYDAGDTGFYCLQPVIVQKKTESWEVVDGQQRLTTLYILLRALFQLENFATEDDFSSVYAGKRLMTLTFETHPEDEAFLRDIATKQSGDVTNINQAHMLAAFVECVRWIREVAPTKCGVASVRKIADAYLDILAVVDDKDSPKKNVQVIWYQLDDDPSVNPICEFLRINSGKIPLTDAELVKALLLQKPNFRGVEAEQLQHALEWENMENTLTQPAFWGMLTGDVGVSDRMKLILEMLYRKDHGGVGPLEKGDIFRHFAGYVEHHTAADLWNVIVRRFGLLETWFEDPLIHNYVGLLAHFGTSVYEIMNLYDGLPEDADRTAFVRKLVAAVKAELSKIKIEQDKIALSYDGDGKLIRKLLLFVNVMQSNHRVEELEGKPGWNRRDVGFFKFPFALFDAQNWNVEHVDSFTQNPMRNQADQDRWICEAVKRFPELANDPQARAFDRPAQNREYIEYVQRVFDCGDDDPEEKNGVGNLVLLDEVTNKGYGNHVFAVKSDIIRENVRRGVFVPICTQWVFQKTLAGCNGAEKLKWAEADKLIYHDFILKELRDFRARD